MKPVISLASVRKAKESSLEEAWQRFVDAHLKAQSTLKIEDGLKASRAYHDFIELSGRPNNG